MKIYILNFLFQGRIMDNANALKRCTWTVGDLIPRPLRAFGFRAISLNMDAWISLHIFHSPPHMAFKYFFCVILWLITRMYVIKFTCRRIRFPWQNMKIVIALHFHPINAFILVLGYLIIFMWILYNDYAKKIIA